MLLSAVGVAICSLDRVTPNKPITPSPIQKWPGGTKTQSKVPTSVTYKAGDFRVRSWGFSCPSKRTIGPEMSVRRLFKFYLDEKCLAEFNKEKPIDDQESIENVRNWWKDFLFELHKYIVAFLQEDPKWQVDWGLTKVDFIFSLPTSWYNKGGLKEEYEKIIKAAGFGSELNSNVDVELTEGIASAVYTAKSLKHEFKVCHTSQYSTGFELIYEF